MKKIIIGLLLLFSMNSYGQKITTSKTLSDTAVTWSGYYRKGAQRIETLIPSDTLWKVVGSKHTHTKAQVGLGNVDNTSDANKPISTATQAALNGKENTITAGTNAQYWRGDKSWQTLNTTAVTEGTNLYYTDTRARAAMSAGTGLTYSAGVFSQPVTTYDARYASLTGSYANPSWLTSLAWSKLTSTPTTIAGYGITDYNTLGDARYFRLTGGAITGNTTISKSSPLLTYDWSGIAAFSTGVYGTTSSDSRYSIHTNSAGEALSVNYLNGNVGIGTTTPSNKLEVIGDTKLTGKLTLGTNQWSLATSDGIDRMYFANNADNFYRTASSTSSHVFRFNNTDHVTLSPDAIRLYNDNIGDLQQLSSSVGVSNMSRSFIHRREADSRVYQFFDWNGTTGREWWKVDTVNDRFSVATILTASYGVGVAIGSAAPHASAILDIQSTTKGVRLPNMTTTEVNAIASPAAGLQVYNTTINEPCYYNGTAWKRYSGGVM
jgi:hypothetical protein